MHGGRTFPIGLLGKKSWSSLLDKDMYHSCMHLSNYRLLYLFVCWYIC